MKEGIILSLGYRSNSKLELHPSVCTVLTLATTVTKSIRLCDLHNRTNYTSQLKQARSSRTTPLSRRKSLSAASLLDDRRRLDDLLAEEMTLDKVRKPDLQLVAEELLCWDREDLIDLFERLILC